MFWPQTLTSPSGEPAAATWAEHFEAIGSGVLAGDQHRIGSLPRLGVHAHIRGPRSVIEREQMDGIGQLKQALNATRPWSERKLMAVLARALVGLHQGV